MDGSPILKVLEIFRSRKMASTFFILTKESLHRVDQEMYVKILQGYVYKNDVIRITKEDKTKGIIFEVVDKDLREDFCYSYNDYIYNRYNLLPFLSDTLPYYDREVDTLPDLKTPSLVGTIVYKTRINQTNLSQYIFFILKTNNELIKAAVWKENLKYSALNINDTVGITKYRAVKKYLAQGPVEYNEFSEMRLFDLNEITVYEMYKITKQEDIVQLDKTSILYNISGFINYRSVLNRRKHNGFSEYYLLNVDDSKVMLFYNSDVNFYNIEAGNNISIYNLRKLTRHDKTIFVSTIFTQFTYENIHETNEMCSTFLNETINKRKMEDESNDTKRKKKNQASEEFDLTNEDLTHLVDDDTVTVNVEIITPNQNISDCINKTDYNKRLFIESAYGYLPDLINETNEEFIKIDDRHFSVSPFFVPKKINLAELEEYANKLVINESDKFILEGRVLDIMTSSEFYISYIDTNCIKHQYPLTVFIENAPPVYIFDNFFVPEINDIGEKVYKCKGKECTIILHVFRASIDLVIYNISDIQLK